jgi:hypothetical protein
MGPAARIPPTRSANPGTQKLRTRRLALVVFFNADDQTAALNSGSYLDIPRAIRDQASRSFEPFVIDHIERGVSCAFEITLRTSFTFLNRLHDAGCNVTPEETAHSPRSSSAATSHPLFDFDDVTDHPEF